MAEIDTFHNLDADTVLKSVLVFKMLEGYKYAVKMSGTKTAAISILNAAERGPIASNWLMRFDRPHKGANFNHINFRHKYTGINGAHIKLPPGGLYAAQTAFYVCKALDYMCYFAIAVDAARLGNAIYKDYQELTKKNTADCAVGISSQWIGGIVGATAGKALGALIIPGVGPIVGALGLSYMGVTYGYYYGMSYWKKYQMGGNEHLSYMLNFASPDQIKYYINNSGVFAKSKL